MTTTQRRLRALSALVVIGALASCSSGSSTGAAGSTTATGSSSTTTTPSPTSTTSLTATTSSTARSSSSSKAPAPRTAAGLRSALLSLDDMPSGFAVDPASGGDGGGSATVTSKDPRCAAFVKIFDADVTAGATASADVSFSGGQDGPYIDEAIDALGGAAQVATTQRALAAAVASCAKVTLTLEGSGTSSAAVRAVKAPEYGDHPVAIRLTATGGDLDGFEAVLVATGVADTVVSLSFLGAVADDIDGATGAAVDKATSVLGDGAVTTS